MKTLIYLFTTIIIGLIFVIESNEYNNYESIVIIYLLIVSYFGRYICINIEKNIIEINN